MSTLTLRRTAAAAAVAALAASVAVAQPADAGDVGVTVTVTAADGASALYVTHATDPVTLGSTTFDTATSSTVSANLPLATVTDERGQLLAPWTVQVSGTNLGHTSDATHSIAATNARVYMDAADLAGVTSTLLGTVTGMTVTGAEYNTGTNNLSSPYTLIEGTTDLGNGSLEYTPTMDVVVPANTPAGDYTGTVTQTVS